MYVTHAVTLLPSAAEQIEWEESHINKLKFKLCPYNLERRKNKSPAFKRPVLLARLQSSLISLQRASHNAPF